MNAIVCQTRFGACICPPLDVYLGLAMIRRGVYAPEEFAAWTWYLDPGDVVVDAGANCGAHTLAFASLVGPQGLVIAIEPQRMLANMLAGSLALNGLRHVLVHQVALGRASGHVVIPPIDYGAPGNFGGVELGGEAPTALHGERVPVVPLDAMQLPRIDFLKVDVEGMEAEVLAGAEQTIARTRPVLSLEADREPQVPALLEWLSAHDYRAWWHRPPLGDLWPGIVSINLLAIPRERDDCPDPLDYVEEVLG